MATRILALDNSHLFSLSSLDDIFNMKSIGRVLNQQFLFKGSTSTEDSLTISTTTESPDLNTTSQENITAFENNTSNGPWTSAPPTVAPPRCPDGAQCHTLGPECLDCQFNYHCHYGKDISVNCTIKEEIKCIVSRNINS